MYELHQLVYFSANRSGIPRFVQCQFSVLPHHFGRTLDGHIRRLARDVISIPKTLGRCTAFQFGLNTRQLCFRAPHTLKNIFIFVVVMIIQLTYNDVDAGFYFTMSSLSLLFLSCSFSSPPFPFSPFPFPPLPHLSSRSSLNSAKEYGGAL